MMGKSCIMVLYILLLSGFCNTSFSQVQVAFDYTDFIKNNVGISSLQFSPDGKTLLFNITKVDWENNRRKSEYILMNVSTKNRQVLSFKERNVTQIKWSPSGNKLSFLALSDTSGSSQPQIYVKNYPNGNSHCITASKSGVLNYSWSPNEDKLVYIAVELPIEKTGPDKFINSFEVGNNGYLTTVATFPSHLWMIESKGGIAKRLTQGSWTARTVDWLQDGSSIIFTKGETPYSGDGTKNRLALYDIQSGQIINLTNKYASESNPILSPNGSIAFQHSKNDIAANIQELSVAFANKGKVVSLSQKLDRTVTGYEWMANGNTLLVTTINGTRDNLFILGVDDKMTPVALGDITSVGEFTVNSTGLVALTGSTVNKPFEIYFLQTPLGAMEKITNYNNYIENIFLGKTETLEWNTTDGLIADGVITFPTNFNKSNKYPLVLFIHGGPTSSSKVSLNPFAQQLAANGWVVLQPNYRGSNNRGNRFQSAIANDGGKGPGEDIMSGVELLKQKGFVDEKNIAVTGWSYGGYMTAWLIGKYPDMWKAAVAGAAPVDVTDMTSLTLMNVMTRHALTSSPWKGDNYKKYYEMSPMSNFSKLKTPTLVMSVVGDEIVSVTGSYKLYHALKANGIPVQFFAYPGKAHFPADPVNSTDVYQRWSEWLKRYLK